MPLPAPLVRSVSTRPHRGAARASGHLTPAQPRCRLTVGRVIEIPFEITHADLRCRGRAGRPAPRPGPPAALRVAILVSAPVIDHRRAPPAVPAPGSRELGSPGSGRGVPTRSRSRRRRRSAPHASSRGRRPSRAARGPRRPRCTACTVTGTHPPRRRRRRARRRLPRPRSRAASSGREPRRGAHPVGPLGQSGHPHESVAAHPPDGCAARRRRPRSDARLPPPPPRPDGMSQRGVSPERRA